MVKKWRKKYENFGISCYLIPTVPPPNFQFFIPHIRDKPFLLILSLAYPYFPQYWLKYITI